MALSRDRHFYWSGDRHKLFFLVLALKDVRTGHVSALPVLDIYRDLEEELERFLESDPRDGTNRSSLYKPSAPEARLGTDNADGHCVCGCHQSDD